MCDGDGPFFNSMTTLFFSNFLGLGAHQFFQWYLVVVVVCIFYIYPFWGSISIILSLTDPPESNASYTDAMSKILSSNGKHPSLDIKSALSFIGCVFSSSRIFWGEFHVILLPSCSRIESSFDATGIIQRIKLFRVKSKRAPDSSKSPIAITFSI